MPPPTFVATHPYRWSTGLSMASDGPGNANAAIYVPCIFPEACTLTSVSVLHTNSTGNYDLGFYNTSYVRQLSKGSTAVAAGLGTLSLSNFAVNAGDCYFVGYVTDNVGTRYIGATLTAAILVASAGCTEQASALPLPATATPAIPSSWPHIPVITFACT